MAASSSILESLARPEHQKIWKEVAAAAEKDGIDQEALKKVSPYVYVAMEKLRKKLNPSGPAMKRKQDAERSPPTTNQSPPPTHPPKKKQKAAGIKEEGKKEKKEDDTTKHPQKEFENLKDYNIIIVGIPSMQIEESPKLKIIKLPYMDPEKLAAVLKETNGWDKTNHAVVVIPRAWSDIKDADTKIYNLMDVIEKLSSTLELSFLAPPVDDKTPADILDFICRVKTKMMVHDLPSAKFSRGRVNQKWYADAISDFVKLIMEKEEDAVMKSASQISIDA